MDAYSPYELGNWGSDVMQKLIYVLSVYALFTACSCVLVFGELQGCKYFCYN
jgi:hypothetical protein